ncbi:MAG: DUF2877 domain-containing protein [Burkholderiales bacterium]
MEIPDCVGDLVPAQARGRVHSVFRRACNIETESGELITLLAGDLGNLPHGIRLAGPVASFAAWLSEGQAAILEEGILRVPDAGFTLNLSGTAIWRGTVSTPSVEALHMHLASPDSGNIAVALRELRATLLAHAPEQGIAPLLRDDRNARSPLDRALATRLKNALPEMAHATRKRDAGAIAALAARLVGLGEGLTPSGDDFLVGYLAALWSRADREQGIDTLLRKLKAPLEEIFSQTHAISRQMLCDALQDRFAEGLVDVVRALTGSGHVFDATMQALRSGHSSGADTLCGLLFGVSPALIAPEKQSRLQSRVARPWQNVSGAGPAAPIAC